MGLKKWYDDKSPYEQRDIINLIIKVSGLVILVSVLAVLFG
jgi:hypothetical protein